MAEEEEVARRWRGGGRGAANSTLSSSSMRKVRTHRGFEGGLSRDRLARSHPPEPGSPGWKGSATSVWKAGSSGIAPGADGAMPGPKSALYIRSSATPGKSGR